MSDKRIGIGARPLADPQAEAWIRQGVAIDHGKVERYSARLTLDVTPALRTRIKLAAFDRGVTMERCCARCWSSGQRHDVGNSPGMATAETAHRRMFAPGSTALATSPPRLIHKRSDSVPDGRYRTSPANSLAPSDLMLVHLLLEECNGCAARPPAGDRTVVEDRGGDGTAALVHAR